MTTKFLSRRHHIELVDWLCTNVSAEPEKNMAWDILQVGEHHKITIKDDTSAEKFARAFPDARKV